MGNVAHLGATLPAGSPWQAAGFEVLLTAGLMIVIMAVATDTRAVGQAAAFAIGATVGLEALFAGPISGASMNPGPVARTGSRQRHLDRTVGVYRSAARGSGARGASSIAGYGWPAAARSRMHHITWSSSSQAAYRT